MNPSADIPVVQLSLNALKPLDHHVALATKLDSLRSKGVLLITSGNVVHNLRRLQRDEKDLAYDWAERFDDAVLNQLGRSPDDILRLAEQS